MDEVKGIARAKIRPGKLAEYKRLCDEAMKIVRTQDKGTLQYEIFFNADETEAMVYERYRDAQSAVDHFAHIGHLMQPLLETADVTGELMANPSDKFTLGSGGPGLYTPWRTIDEDKP